MGLFDFLFGGKKPTNVQLVTDRIWLTTDAKFAGLAKEAEERARTETVAILLVAHFPDVLARLEEIANQKTWDVPCKAILASDLNTNLAKSLSLDESAILDVIVGERHPLPSVDDRLEEFAETLPCRCRFSHHLSLDDAMFRAFGGDWVKNLLKKLGMSENEAISNPVVSRHIRKAQQKIEGRTFGSLDAESGAAWLEKNCPEMMPK